MILDELLNVPVFHGLRCIPRIHCVDGFSMSVQASAQNYCTPRSDVGPYTHVEVGFPSEAPPENWKEYAEDWEAPTDTVYANVPMFDVMLLLAAHGGIDMNKTQRGNRYQ